MSGGHRDGLGLAEHRERDVRLGRVPGGLRPLGGVRVECRHGSLTGVPGALAAVGVLRGVTAVVRLDPSVERAQLLGGALDDVQLSRGEGVQQGPQGRHLGGEAGAPHEVDVGSFDAGRAYASRTASSVAGGATLASSAKSSAGSPTRLSSHARTPRTWPVDGVAVVVERREDVLRR